MDMDSALDIGGPSEPSLALPPLRAWRVTDEMNLETIVQAHQLNPDGEMLQFVTYVMAGHEAIGQITDLMAKGSWRRVKAITVQPEGTSVQ